MRRLALLAALALAPTRAASADPPDRDRGRGDERYRDADSYSDGFYERGGRRLDRDRRQWTPIAEQYSATSERQFINVGERSGSFRRLLVEGVRGAPVIEKIAVEYEDHQTQVWDLKRRLPRGADQVISLGGSKRIHRIVVYTNPSHRGAYSIYGA
jgi:hypothetical protein